MKQLAVGKMFTFRLSSYRFLQYLLIIFVSSGVIANQQKPLECAAQGEYCLNHWDCCSNSCLSYLYKCTRGHGIYPYSFLGVSYKPTVTLDDILNQNFGSSNSLPNYQHQAKPYFVNRLGGDNDFPASENEFALQKPKVTTKEKPTPQINVDLKEGVTMGEHQVTTLKHSTDLKNDLESTLKNSNGLNFDTTTLKNSVETSTLLDHSFGGEKTEAPTNSASETTQDPVKRSPENTSCAHIGEKCYSSDDCCEKLCHGYLHQCVT